METIKVTLELPAVLSVAIRGEESVTCNTKDVPADILALCIEYGWQQKNADGASGAARVAASSAGVDMDNESAVKAWLADESNKAAIASVRRGMIESNVADRCNGVWASRAPASESDPLDTFRVRAVRNLVKGARAGTIKDKGTVAKLVALGDAYDAIPSDDQSARRAHYLAFAAAHSAAIDPVAEELRAASQPKAIKL